MSIKYHGRYCGPGWSAGKYQQSVKSTVPPEDRFDATCKEHDGAYAKPTNSKARSKADDKFFRENIGGGPKRAIAALAVKATSKIMRAHERNPKGLSFRGSHKPPKKSSAVSRARARLDQHPRLTQHGQLINSITNKLISTRDNPSPTMNKVTRQRKNNAVTRAPVATSKTVRMTKPKTTTRGNVTIVSHREYLQSVISSTGTRIVTINVNPGISAFSWLAPVANSFEQYVFKKLKYEYVSAAATSERGRVSLSFQFDPTADAPTTRTDHFSIVPNVEEAPWEDIVLNVPCTNTLKYLRQGSITAGTLNTYDVGKLNIMSAMNADSTTQLGEIFVTYVVELHNPQFNKAAAGETRATSPSSTNPFGTGSSVVSGQSTISWVSATTMMLNTTQPQLIVLRVVGTTLAQTNPTITLSAGSAGAFSIKQNIINAALTEQWIIFTTKGTQPDDLITVIGGESGTISSTIIYQGVYISA